MTERSIRVLDANKPIVGALDPESSQLRGKQRSSLPLNQSRKNGEKKRKKKRIKKKEKKRKKGVMHMER